MAVVNFLNTYAAMHAAEADTDMINQFSQSESHPLRSQSSDGDQEPDGDRQPFGDGSTDGNSGMRVKVSFIARRCVVGIGIAALTLLLLYISSIFQNAYNLFLFLASLCVIVAVIEVKTLGALLIYLTISLLSIFLIGIDIVWPFMGFFGVYPLIKAFAEGHWNWSRATFFKLTASIVIVSITVRFCAYSIWQEIFDPNYLWIGVLTLALLLGSPLFLLFDYMLTIMITEYLKHRS